MEGGLAIATRTSSFMFGAKGELPPRLTHWPSDAISHSDQALAKSTPVRRLASELEVAVGSSEPLQVEDREALNSIALAFSQLLLPTKARKLRISVQPFTPSQLATDQQSSCDFPSNWSESESE